MIDVLCVSVPGTWNTSPPTILEFVAFAAFTMRINYADVTAWFVETVQQYELFSAWVYYDSYSARYFVEEMQMQGFTMVRCIVLRKNDGQIATVIFSCRYRNFIVSCTCFTYCTIKV